MVCLAFGHGALNTKLAPATMSFAEFAEGLRRPEVGPKDGQYYLRGGDLAAPFRANENLRAADVVILDGDSGIDPADGAIVGAPPLPEVTAVLDKLGFAYVAHTTHSYSLERWKYRVIVPAKMCDEADLRAVVGWLIAQLHGAGVFLNNVRENEVWAQLWYTPRISQPDSPFESLANLNGAPVDVEACRIWHQRELKHKAAEQQARQSTPKRVSNDPSPIERFNAEHGLDWVRSRLDAEGYRFAYYDKADDAYRYVRPGSTTGTPGVVVFKGKYGDWCTWSHHGDEDPLSGRVCDPFELRSVFEFGSDRKAAVRELLAKALNTEGGELATDSRTRVSEDDRPFVRIRPAAVFAGEYRPAEYIVDGLLQGGFLYSLTAPTGTGKTSVALLLAKCVADGSVFASREVERGKVLFCGGENPDDLRQRFLSLCDQEGRAPGDYDIEFLTAERYGSLIEGHREVVDYIAGVGGVKLVIVDTSAAFFIGQDENANTELGDYARKLRRLTDRKSTRLNSSHTDISRMPSSA